MTKGEPGAFSIAHVPSSFGAATRLRFMGEEICELGSHETMGIWFERLGHLKLPLTPGQLSMRLNEGITSVDEEIVETVKPLLPQGTYLVGLFYVVPKALGTTSGHGFTDVVSVPDAWLTRFSTLPVFRGTYRELSSFTEAEAETRERWEEREKAKQGPPKFPGCVEVEELCAAHEFVYPLCDLRSLNEEHIQRPGLNGGTALALSVYNGCRPGGGPLHEVLSHFLLDGHHKMARASRRCRPVAVLSFLLEDWFGVRVPLEETSIRKPSEYLTHLPRYS